MWEKSVCLSMLLSFLFSALHVFIVLCSPAYISSRLPFSVQCFLYIQKDLLTTNIWFVCRIKGLYLAASVVTMRSDLRKIDKKTHSPTDLIENTICVNTEYYEQFSRMQNLETEQIQWWQEHRQHTLHCMNHIISSMLVVYDIVPHSLGKLKWIWFESFCKMTQTDKHSISFGFPLPFMPMQ